jgi:hypothetical protein
MLDDSDAVLKQANSESSTAALPGTVPPRVRQLGPRWDDYSFREADLFYVVPRTVEMGNKADEPAGQHPALRPSISAIWASLKGRTAQKGEFAVLRNHSQTRSL